MKTTYILVDYENGQNHDLSLLRDGDYRVHLFHGPHQNKFPVSFTKTLLPLGAGVELIQSDQQAKEALDLHMAFYLGRLALEHPDAKFVIVSADKGFEPLMRHARAMGYDVEQIPFIREAQSVLGEAAELPKVSKATTETGARATPSDVHGPSPKATNTQAPAKPKQPAKKPAAASTKPTRTKLGPDDRAKVIENLRKVGAKRPSKRKTLERHIVSIVGNDVTAQAAQKLVKELEADGVLAFEQTKVTYKLPKPVKA